MLDKLTRLKIKGDGIIWMVFFLLCIISVLEVYSASSSLTYKAGNYWKPVLYHTILLLFGVGFMIVTMNIKCKYFKIVTPFALLLSLIMLIAVLVVGQSTNGAQRWIGLFGIQFQPSEIAKGAVILAEAQILSAMQTIDGADRRAFRYILYISLPIVFLIAMENLSTAALLFLTVIIMMFIGRVPKQQLGRLLGVLTLLAAFGFAMIMLIGNEQKETASSEKMNMTEQVTEKKEETGILSKVFHRADTWKARIIDFMDHTEVAPEDVDLDKDAQKSHAKIAIASSNIVGKGPGNSVERDFLSQAFSDFIYAIIIEEMGIIGAAVVCLLYIILLFRTATIANRCANAFPALLIMGIALLLVTQAMFNMAVAVGLAPVTGQPLPLISKGGTSTIVNCIYVGIILSVSYTAKRKDEPTEKKTPAKVALATA
ncbi:MAG: FtsW/RodA/SpoVE family cell cycle protein [Prevotella sp.]|nr:FtsW/RodA/SpoVE family cell cycle protein [Prevotella sp.]